MTDLEQLAVRVEVAEGPDRELDVAIAAALNVNCLPGATKHVPFPEMARMGMVELRFNGCTSYQDAARYTASIDAALQLADEDTAAQALREAFSMVQMLSWPEGDFKGALARFTVAAILRAKAVQP